MKQYLMNDCGMKIKDQSAINIVRLYNEILDYQKTGKLPAYLLKPDNI